MQTKKAIAKDTSLFGRLATEASRILGSVSAFGVALGIVILWAATGPLFGYSDTWQLVINTGTTIITFLMVFLIQNTQNRDGAAMQLKLDEIIRATKGAHNALMDLEKLSEQDLEEIRLLYQQLAEKARHNKKGAWGDIGTPEVPTK